MMLASLLKRLAIAALALLVGLGAMRELGGRLETLAAEVSAATAVAPR